MLVEVALRRAETGPGGLLFSLSFDGNPRPGLAERQGSHMAIQWFYQTSEGQQSGPVDSRELHRLAEAGIVRPDTLVRQGDSGRWVRAEHVRGLFQQSTAPPSSSPGASPPGPPPVPESGAPSRGVSGESSIRHGLRAAAVNNEYDKICDEWERKERRAKVGMWLNAVKLAVTVIVVVGLMKGCSFLVVENARRKAKREEERQRQDFWKDYPLAEQIEAGGPPIDISPEMFEKSKNEAKERFEKLQGVTEHQRTFEQLILDWVDDHQGQPLPEQQVMSGWIQEMRAELRKELVASPEIQAVLARMKQLEEPEGPEFAALQHEFERLTHQWALRHMDADKLLAAFDRKYQRWLQDSHSRIAPSSTRQQTVMPQPKGTTAPGRSDLAGEPYFDTSHGFSITFPSGWTVKKSSNPETIIKAVYRDSSDNIALIVIAGYKLPYKPSKEELTVDVAWEVFQKQYQDFSLKRRGSGTAKIGSKDAVWNTVEITAPPQARSLAKHYHFIQGSTLYTVSAISDSGEAFFTANLPLMDEAISTLAFGR